MLDTVGSFETILKILATYQIRNRDAATAESLWSAIADYSKKGGKYRFYSEKERLSETPCGSFVCDIQRLIDQGYVKPGDNGSLNVTPFGIVDASGLRLPLDLETLEIKAQQP